MSRLVTKPTKWLCAQRRLRSAWASAQSDQSLRCPHEESLGPKQPNKRTAKTLIRLGGCPGWSESSLGAQSFRWFCHEAAHITVSLRKPCLFYELPAVQKISIQFYIHIYLCSNIRWHTEHTHTHTKRIKNKKKKKKKNKQTNKQTHNPSLHILELRHFKHCK